MYKSSMFIKIIIFILNYRENYRMSYIKKRVTLFKLKSFNYIIFASFISSIITGMAYVSMIWHILSLNNSIKSMVIFLATWWLPQPLLAPITGFIADKYSKKNIVLFCNIFRTLLLLTVFYILNLNNYL